MYFFDTYALIELFVGNPKYRSFTDFAFTVSALNIGELYLYLVRTYDRNTAKDKIDALHFNLVDMSKELMVAAAEFKLMHSRKKLSWADCIGYSAARQLNLKFLTGDSQFEGLPNVEFVK